MQGLFQSLFRVRFGSRMKQFEGIPGPVPSYPLGTLGDLLGKKPWDVFADYGKKYGGITLIWMGGQPTVVLNDPKLIAEVLITKTGDYYKDYPIKALRPVLKNTLFNLNPPELTALRKPHSHPLLIDGFDQWLRSQFPIIKGVVDKHLNSMLAENKEVLLIDRMQRIFFDVFNRITCGPDFQDGGFENFYAISVMATTRMETPQKLLFPPLKPSFHQAMRLHYGAYEKAVSHARQHPDPNASHLLQVFLRQGTQISDAQLVDFMSEFHAGGNISAAAAIVNTLHLLNGHPAIANDLYQQLSSIQNNLDLESLEQVPLVDHVLRESLRMIPPVAVYGRNVSKDKSTMLGDYELPPDTPVLICAATVQRSHGHWTNPDEFNPGRWAQGGVAANPIGSDYFFPFGRGPRMCAGAELAVYTMKILLASILGKVSIQTSGPFEGVMHCGVIETPALKGRLIPHSRPVDPAA